MRPLWRILGPRHELLLALRGDEPPGRGERLDGEAAVRALDLALLATPAWGFAARALDDVARALRAPPGEARRAVERALRDGRLRLWREPLRQLAAPLHDAHADDLGGAPPLASSLLEKTWIEIELTDMEGNPRAGERYWIELPDGSVREGALDEHGRAYFGGLDPGSCEVRWPDLDEEATVPVERAASAPRPEAPAPRDWIEIELTDMEGNPRAGERYWIQLTDGSVRQGLLDDDGRARFDDLDPGECEVRWPDLDDEATIAGGDVTVGRPEDEDDEVAVAQAETLIAAAAEGVPFCEECARAAARGAAA